MTTYTITSNDTLVLNGNVFNDLAADDVTTIAFPNDLVNMKTGKNGNTIMAQNQQGFNATLSLRLLRGSSDDQFMESILAASLKDFPGTSLIAGSFTKMLGDGQGNIIHDVYDLAGGVISKMVEGKENTSGDTLQAEAVYTVKFASAIRVLQ